jgi:mRNA interferase RelE/StbE
VPTYRVEFTPKARKQIDALAVAVRRRVDAAIMKLETVPFPSGVKALKGEDAVYRIRVGDYRVLYTVDGGLLLVLILETGHRREVYR